MLMHTQVKYLLLKKINITFLIFKNILILFTSYSYFKLYLFDVLLIFIIFELNSKVTITMIIQKSIILLDEI